MSTQCVTFHLDDHVYGVDVRSVQEVLPARTVSRVPLSDADVAGLVNLRGQVVLALDLRVRLGLPAYDGEQMLVVVDAGPERVALLVDRIGDVVTVTREEFEAAPATLPPALRRLVGGAYKLEGHLLLALDVAAATAADPTTGSPE